MLNADKIAEILFELDPAGLVSAGVPKDEYKNEAKMLVERLKGEETPEDVAQHLVDIFDQMFNFGSKIGEGPICRIGDNRYEVKQFLSAGQTIVELQ